MKRTLSLVLALVMVLGSFTAVFAAPAAELDAAEFLATVGVLQGNDDGELMLENNLERRDAVILLSRLLGVEDEAAEFLTTEESPSWEDARTDAYYVPYFAWAQENGYFEGDDEGNFNPRNAITAQEYALVLLRAMGYDVKGHDAWANALETAKEAGLLEGVEVENKDEVVRGQMAVMTLNALKAENGKLAEKLEIELPTPAELEVVAVTADNLKEVEVVFNQEVDADTVVKANVSVKGQAGSVTLKEDGVTAVITLDAGKELTNQKEYTLVVDKVKAATGVEIAKTELKFKAFDATLPEVLGVEVTGPRNFSITFSEPIKEKGKVTVKQDKVTVGNSIAESDPVGSNKINVTAYTNFVEGKEYEVTVENFVDYATYKNVIEVLKFTYEKDENPPVATVEKVEQEYVIVSFNKPVKGLKLDSFYHTFSAWNPVELQKVDGTKIDLPTTAAFDEVKVVFYKGGEHDKAIPAGSTVFGINGKEIKDNWGNALGNQEFTISASADRTAPEVTAIEVQENNELKITFSKEVNFARKNIEILDAEGKKISGLYISSISSGPDKEFTVKYNKDLAGKSITVSIKDVKDTTLFENVLSLYTEVIEIEDVSRPSVTAVYFQKSPKTSTEDASATIVIQFKNSVDPETALNISNYTLVVEDEEPKVLDGNADFDVLDSRVKLTLTAKNAEKLYSNLSTANKLQIINVKGLNGETILPKLYELNNLSVESESVKYTVKATGTRQLTVEFEALLTNVSPKYFAVGDDNYGEEFTLTQQDDTKTTLIFDLSKDAAIKHDKTDAKFRIAADHKMQDAFGNDVTFNTNTVLAAAIKDSIKPIVELDADDEYVVSVDVYEDKDVVKIAFSEEMDVDTFATGSFAVEGRTVTKLQWNAGNTEVTLILKDILKDGAPNNPTEGYAAVSYKQEVKDKAGNALDLEIGAFAEVDYSTK